MEAKQQAVGDTHVGTWVMGSPVPPLQAHPTNKQAPATWPSTAGLNPSPYPTYSDNGNPYVQVTPVPGSKDKGSMDTVLKLLGRCGKKVEDGTRKAADVAGNVWHHLKMSANVRDAAMARLSQGTKALVKGGHDKIFQQTFGILPREQFRKAFACYISTSSGPVIGTLYVSTQRLAFCSDNPIHYSSVGPQEWVYYKVVVQLDRLRAVSPSVNKRNPAEKYIQVITTDDHEFWFMGFVSFDKAIKALSESLHRSHW